MPCRVGITTNLKERRAHWEGEHPSLRSWKTLLRTSSKTVAQAKETVYAGANGCEHGPGGGGPQSATWYVYHFIYGTRSNH